VVKPRISPLPRKVPLCASLCLALALGPASLPVFAAPPPPIVVQNCGDDPAPGSGSLRDAIASASTDGTIDLSQLPTTCGMTDAVITLTHGEIPIGVDNLKLQGPSVGTVTIEPGAGSQSRVLNHTGAGQLTISDLTIANGNVQAGANTATGGCIRSSGAVFLTRSSVRDCSANGSAGYGGGMYAHGVVILLVFAYEGALVSYSALIDNETSGVGGGILTAGGSTSIYNSTIEGGIAARGGAAFFVNTSGVTILDSTISYNTASQWVGGVFVQGQAHIANSTIAHNSGASISGGLLVESGDLLLESSIIADNASPGVPDFDWANSTVAGADNLVMSSAPLPGVIKLTSDPLLGPLQYNGGRTRTHMLMAGSPAIGAGNDNAVLWIDQRGSGYPRFLYSGGSYLTDIGAVQREWIFNDGFDG